MSQVFFTKDLTKITELFTAAGIEKIISPNDSVALKIHFGEPGNTAYIKYDRVKSLEEKIISLGGKPFFTDCNTLYKGPRSNTKEHLQVAKDHGYSNVIIPEEDDSLTLKTDFKHCQEVYLGGVVERANTLIALTHFKGHELTGFGGALKNLGMGLASRKGKLEMHSDCDNCKAKDACKKKETITACWICPSTKTQEKIVEYAAAGIQSKQNKIAYINFITDVSENCDCFDHNSEPIVPDIGILASFDPVAIDQASVDLVNQTEGRLKSHNKFRALHCNVDWAVQLKYAEMIGMGNRSYKLIV